MQSSEGNGVTLDQVDQHLVHELQRDGRASYEALAQQVGLSRSATKTRVDRLLGEGGLRLIGAIHPAVFGLHQLGHVIIESHGPVRSIAEQVAEQDEITFVTTTAGRFAITAEIRTEGLDAFSRALAKVTVLAGVTAVQVVTFRHIWKDPYFPPGPLDGTDAVGRIQLDAADHALLSQLRDNGRAPFTELAKAAGLSAGATRARVLRLLNSGVVHIGALVRLYPFSDTHTIGFALTLSGEPEQTANQVAALDEVDAFATGLGWCDGIGTIRTRSATQAFTALEQLRALPGINTVEAWTHLQAIKEDSVLRE